MRIPIILISTVLLLAGCSTPERSTINGSGQTLGFKDSMPKALTRFDPVYPYELIKQGVSCDAIVEFIVDTDGNVIHPKVVKATRPGFEQSCIDCILKWKFAPAVKDGRPANARMQQVFTFNIQNLRG